MKKLILVATITMIAHGLHSMNLSKIEPELFVVKHTCLQPEISNLPFHLTFRKTSQTLNGFASELKDWLVKINEAGDLQYKGNRQQHFTKLNPPSTATDQCRTNRHYLNGSKICQSCRFAKLPEIILSQQLHSILEQTNKLEQLRNLSNIVLCAKHPNNIQNVRTGLKASLEQLYKDFTITKENKLKVPRRFPKSLSQDKLKKFNAQCAELHNKAIEQLVKQFSIKKAWEWKEKKHS
ncbi:hypothetical protein HOL34_01995 [bacterium]|jgi:hypothetical protein|nr:hypothetical protein [bacterium]MBT3903374.1 hypothetical protein [bacterium]MBT4577683.1 hypothetical protein [bacterium]MBT5345841.1 hypothetical protein [bacterium]MBT6130820.1 hypothetical protein [bacterium]